MVVRDSQAPGYCELLLRIQGIPVDHGNPQESDGLKHVKTCSKYEGTV